MANIMIRTRFVEHHKGSPLADQLEGGSSTHNSEDGLSDIEADISELMAPKGERL